MSPRVRLVGDGVENPANAEALADAAQMFKVPCSFRDSRGLAEFRPELPTMDTASLLSAGPLVVVDNVTGAESVYRAGKVQSGASIVVGNERRGVRPDLLRAAAKTVQIPMPGRGVNTLNVATAAAVALYYLLDAHGRRRQARAPRPDSHRPSLLLAAPRDHVEAGSSLRSAAAFGWQTVVVDDREKVWFGTPRPLRNEARAAARSHRNPLRVVPAGDAWSSSPGRIVVCTTNVDGPPVHQVQLVGPGTALVIPDGDGWEPPPDAEFARVAVPGDPSRYRFLTGIVLAEAARQLGTRTAAATRPPRQGLSYRSGLNLTPPDIDPVQPWELTHY